MKNIVSTDDSLKRHITDSISENLTESDLESTRILGEFSKIMAKIPFSAKVQSRKNVGKIFRNF